jgi:hypothetical protein
MTERADLLATTGGQGVGNTSSEQGAANRKRRDARGVFGIPFPPAQGIRVARLSCVGQQNITITNINLIGGAHHVPYVAVER